MNYKNIIIDTLEKKTAKIGIFGLGYVGLPLALNFAEENYEVFGFDIDINKIKIINEGKSYISYISEERISSSVKYKKFKPTQNFELVTDLDALIFCVPTPLNKYREPDLSFIINLTEKVVPFLKKGQVISLESTTYPGTTEEVILPLLENNSFDIGNNFFLIYSPEREDPGNKSYNTSNIPKIMGGITQNCNEVGLSLYKNVISEVIPVSSTKVAEMTKLLENIHRSVNIGLVNELKPLAEKMGIDIYEVIRAAASKPFGFVSYYPGPGIGGHCIPIDPFYLTWKAREYGMHTRFIELAGEINNLMPKYVIDRTTDALNARCKSIKSSNFLILGVSYKKNVDDLRQSPSIEIIKILLSKGAKVKYSDPFISEINQKDLKMSSIELNKKSLIEFDAIILSTDHDDFDYQLIMNHSDLIIDTRGRYSICENIIRA